MKYRIIAACVLLAILVIGIVMHDDTPSTSQGAPAAQPSREDEAMKNLKL